MKLDLLWASFLQWTRIDLPSAVNLTRVELETKIKSKERISCLFLWQQKPILALPISSERCREVERKDVVESRTLRNGRYKRARERINRKKDEIEWQWQYKKLTEYESEPWKEYEEGFSKRRVCFYLNKIESWRQKEDIPANLKRKGWEPQNEKGRTSTSFHEPPEKTKVTLSVQKRNSSGTIPGARGRAGQGGGREMKWWINPSRKTRI